MHTYAENNPEKLVDTNGHLPTMVMDGGYGALSARALFRLTGRTIYSSLPGPKPQGTGQSSTSTSHNGRDRGRGSSTSSTSTTTSSTTSVVSTVTSNPSSVSSSASVSAITGTVTGALGAYTFEGLMVALTIVAFVPSGGGTILMVPGDVGTAAYLASRGSKATLKDALDAYASSTGPLDTLNGIFGWFG